jgi:transcriptional regulator with XRE-family HTH domain
VTTECVIAGQSETSEEATRRMLESDPESGQAYLRRSWLLEAVRALRDARRRAGFTQEEVAQRLHTTQSAIARMESDHDGRMSLHRYVDFAVACESLPLDISLVPLRDIYRFAASQPDAARTGQQFDVWDQSRKVWSTLGNELPGSNAALASGSTNLEAAYSNTPERPEPLAAGIRISDVWGSQWRPSASSGLSTRLGDFRPSAPRALPRRGWAVTKR